MYNEKKGLEVLICKYSYEYTERTAAMREFAASHNIGLATAYRWIKLAEGNLPKQLLLDAIEARMIEHQVRAKALRATSLVIDSGELLAEEEKAIQDLEYAWAHLCADYLENGSQAPN